MYRVSQLMSTPIANSTRSHKGHSGELSPTCIFPSFDCGFLDGESSFECCSIDPLTGSHYACRRSPRLLTNGYYIWTEDSFLCDADGHITLNPSHTSVMYKENLVRASKSWLHGRIFGDADSLPSEDIWLEGIRSLGMYHCNENGSDLDCSSLSDGWESQKPITDTSEASSSGHILSQHLKESSENSTLQPQMRTSAHFQKNISVHSKAGLMHKISFQAILLTVCLIISACARWFIGGELASIFLCTVVVTTAYVAKPLFLSLARYLKATAWAK
ncbi:transmembrane protein 71 isoform X2 [Microtus ochrogaster]|uniref:Transmembrane protein 71 isoform X2 n=1 Tax=Microtus ochrogaster TaxID=79684 RepID=A0ABM0KX90_MICOH|nr:transmembrane protein 71 isoform X2 [Microtus ochrogaster]